MTAQKALLAFYDNKLEIKIYFASPEIINQFCNIVNLPWFSDWDHELAESTIYCALGTACIVCQKNVLKYNAFSCLDSSMIIDEFIDLFCSNITSDDITNLLEGDNL